MNSHESKPETSKQGTLVEFFGEVWIVDKLNYLGDWNVVTFNCRGNWSRSSIAFGLEPSHPHFVRVIAQSPQERRKQAKALSRWERLMPHLGPYHFQGRKYRRGLMWSNVIKKCLTKNKINQ